MRSPYDPRNFGGHSHQIRANYGVHADSALTGLAVLNGDPVGGWIEPSLRGFNWLQATGGNRPTLLLNATPAGGPAVRFTAASSHFMQQTTRLFLQTNRTVLAVVRPITMASLGVVVASSDSNWYVGVLNTAKQTARHVVAAASGQVTSATASTLTANAWVVLGWRWQWDGANAVSVGLWKNGVSLVETAYATGLTAPTGTTWRIGGSASGSNHYDGDVAQMDFLARDLSDAEMANVMAMLMNAHGVT